MAKSSEANGGYTNVPSVDGAAVVVVQPSAGVMREASIGGQDFAYRSYEYIGPSGVVPRRCDVWGLAVTSSDAEGSCMATRDDIEHYLIQTGHPYEMIDNDTWVVRDEANVVISYASPLVIFRAKLMDLPQHRREALFRLLLELNASEMVHGAYGIEDNSIVLIDTLQSEHLDLNELQATLDALLLAIAQDYQKLNAFRE